MEKGWKDCLADIEADKLRINQKRKLVDKKSIEETLVC